MVLVTRQSMTDDSGTFTDGTAVNKAFVDQVYDQIDAQVHSTTNTTVTPKAITDEVVTARGSKASLDARLDIVLNEDGTLKTQASLFTVAEFQAGLGSRNVAVNGDLDDWSAGASAAPDNFTLATVTIVRTGSGEADTNTFGAGRYAAKLTRAAADGDLRQAVIASADFANYANVKGQKVGVAVKVNTGTANLARVTVDDGATTTSSAFHTGSGGVTEGTLTNVQTLTVVHTISGSATKLEVLLEMKNTSGDAYFGGLVVVFAPYAPSDWQPLSAERDATATRRGLVSTGNQTWEGTKTFNDPPIGTKLFSRRSTGDFTSNTDTTLNDVTGLSFPIGANETWEFEFVIHGISTAVADWKHAVTFPAATTAVRYGVSGGIGGATSSTATAGAAVIKDATGGEEVQTVRGLVINGANAGTVQFQSAQNTSEASNTIIRDNSFVVATRIA